MSRHIPCLALFAICIAACGGAKIEASAPILEEEPKTDQSKEAISIIRESYEAMGGIERLRLLGGKALIKAKAKTEGRVLSIEVALDGADRHRLDYVEDSISFIHDQGSCRKVMLNVPVACTAGEEIWITPTRIINGLLFPVGDAAKLRSSFRLKKDDGPDKKSRKVVEIRPLDSNIRMRAAYDKSTGLLSSVSFSVTESDGRKHQWSIIVDDWREVKKVKVPFRRTITLDSVTVLEETWESIDFDADVQSAFDPPVAPAAEQAFSATIPARRVVQTEIEGQRWEIPAPSPAIGGGYATVGEPVTLPAVDAIQMIHHGYTSDSQTILESLQQGVLSGGRSPLGIASSILLEGSPEPGATALMLLYVPARL